MNKLLVFFLLVNKIYSETYYDILGVRRDADDQAIRQAFKTLSRKHHPDKNKDETKEKEIIEFYSKIVNAYETLKDPSKRQEYDQELLYGDRQAQQRRNPYNDFNEFDEGDYEYRWFIYTDGYNQYRVYKKVPKARGGPVGQGDWYTNMLYYAEPYLKYVAYIFLAVFFIFTFVVEGMQEPPQRQRGQPRGRGQGGEGRESHDSQDGHDDRDGQDDQEENEEVEDDASDSGNKSD